MMRINPYLNFDGNCREAFTYYHQVLGGELEAMIDHSDMPMEGIGPEWKDRILHARLSIDGQILMGSDTPPDSYSPPKSMYVSVQVDSIPDADRIFAGLADGGTVQMPLEEQPWAHRFGMVVDRFGIPWMVSYDKE